MEPSCEHSPSKIIKKLKTNDSKAQSSDAMQSQYITDLSWIAPTTVQVEQLFSKCKNVMTCDRRRMKPRVFEAVVFLKENIEWWDEAVVQEMVSKKWDADLGQECNSSDNESQQDDDPDADEW